VKAAIINKINMSDITKHLGQTSAYKSTYDKSLLVREPRQRNRTYLGIKNESLPFVGYDIWNAFEVSTLLSNGCPVSLIAKVTYNCDSEYIVESKSIKLYFNSFNMEKRAHINTIGDAMEFIEDTASEDLSELLGTDVYVTCFKTSEYVVSDNLAGYPVIENEVNYGIDTEFCQYSEDASLLKIGDVLNKPVSQYFSSKLLKSNCKVTSQPDWGDVYIYMKSDKLVDKTSLLQYIVSFRDECHFHEEICEAIYKRLWDTFNPEELLVFCFYVRRGGIDINPIRASHINLVDNDLIDPFKPFIRTGRQ
jgi:7-cyano-7-deazaguanine reductase